MTAEGKVKLKIYTWLRAHMPGLWNYAAPGGAFGRSGIPDRLCLWRGVFFVIEAKANRQSSVSDLQMKELRDIQKNGGISAILFGFEENKLQAIKDEIIKRTQNVWVDPTI